jgi:thiol-disulfide isomerase/thioredoxin
MKKQIACVAVSLALSAFGAAAAAATATGPHRLTEESFAQIKARYAGEPLVVHIWGMTCGPCLRELPKWGALRRAHPEMHLVLIQADQSPAEASEKTLNEAGLSTAESWAVSTEWDEYLRASIDPKWAGDMPRTLMVSAAGETQRMRGVADLTEVRRWLASNSNANMKPNTNSKDRR